MGWGGLVYEHLIQYSVLPISVCGQLVQITYVKGCTCPGDILTYECTVVGGLAGATILRGKSTTFSLSLIHI